MWDRLRTRVTFERRQLRRLVVTHRSLLDKCAANPPTEAELYAFAGLLHSFYNGVENIFKRTTLELGDDMPSSEFWHKELLDGMTQPTPHRGPLISLNLRDRLKEYMQFRHMFRHAYIFNLRWEVMKSLVLDCEPTLKLLEDELDRFFAAGPGTSQP